MRAWSLRLKLIVLVIGLATGSSLIASGVHGWLAFRTLRDEVKDRAGNIASDIAFGITTAQELSDRELLLVEIRNLMAARPTLRWVDVYINGPGGLRPIASSREAAPSRPLDLVIRAFHEGRIVTVPGAWRGGEAWLAAAPVRFGEPVAGVVALAISLEGASRLALSLGEQFLFILVGLSVTVVVSLLLFTDRSINQPIGALLRTMAAVEQGDLSAVPNVARRDEMGQLAGGLTTMLRRIREGHEENARLLERVNRFNEDLRLRVAEATQELADRNEALRQAHERLFDLQRLLGRAQRLAAMGQLTASIAHEIGAPLNSIAVHLQLLARSPALSAQDRQRLVTIDGQIQRLVQTVQERLAATRSGARQLEPTDLNEVVRSVTDLMTPVLAAKGIASSFVPSELLPKIRADGHQLQQVVLNLTTNAMDAMEAGGSLRIETGVDGDMLFLRIADSGPGIPTDVRDRIFEPFFTTKAARQGTGLGLTVCQQIAKTHGGTIQVADTPGGGATFEIRLPLDSGEGSE